MVMKKLPQSVKYPLTQRMKLLNVRIKVHRFTGTEALYRLYGPQGE